MKFYGRENELSALKSECKALDVGSRLAVVTGRRRIGKTTLLLKAAEESALPVLYFFVQRKYTEEELAQSWISQIRTLFCLVGRRRTGQMQTLLCHPLCFAPDT